MEVRNLLRDVPLLDGWRLTRDLTNSLPRQSSSSDSGVLIINPRHCLRNAGESREIRESSAALLKQWHEV